MSNNGEIATLLGVTETDLAELLDELQVMARSMYWAQIEEAVGKALVQARIWNGKEDTREAALAYVSGKLGLTLTPDGGVDVYLLGEVAAQVRPPTSRPIARAERRITVKDAALVH